MDGELESSGWYSFLSTLGFMTFGIAAFLDKFDMLNPANIVFGALVGLVFGFLCRRFLSAFLSMFNSNIKKKLGKRSVRVAVERGLVFLIPASAMALASVAIMGWSVTNGFVSAGVMIAGASASMELGKLKGKQELRDTVLASGVAWIFSLVWLVSVGYLSVVPPYLEGVVGLIRAFSSGIL